MKKSPTTKIVSIEEGEVKTDEYHAGYQVSTSKIISHEKNSNSESLVRIYLLWEHASRWCGKVAKVWC